MKKIFMIIIYLLLCNFLNAQHLKNDGTPDMRYTENKSNSSTSSSTNYSPISLSTSTTTNSNSDVHLKKDGTPDMRYKENKPNSSSTTITPVPKFTSNTNNVYNVKRDSKGKIERSEVAKYEFKKQTGYPNGRPGYVIDHIKPLKKGGCDCPENMQWQTIEEAKAKDKWE